MAGFNPLNAVQLNFNIAERNTSNRELEKIILTGAPIASQRLLYLERLRCAARMFTHMLPCGPCGQLSLGRDKQKRTCTHWQTGMIEHPWAYDMVISATDMVHLDVQRICQLLDAKVGAVWQNLDYCPWTCPSTKARLCTYQACDVFQNVRPKQLSSPNNHAS
jgi:hypothetical protein